MRTSTTTDLFANGFTPQHCPVTRQVLPNMTRAFSGFHISYAGHLSHYDSDTTALVFEGRVFFILNGYHADALVAAADQGGIHACMDLFIERIDQANRLSEHRIVGGLADDIFELRPTVEAMIGADGIARITQACS